MLSKGKTVFPVSCKKTNHFSACNGVNQIIVLISAADLRP